MRRVETVRRGAELLKSHRLHFETVRPLAENTLHIISKLKDMAATPGTLGGKESTPSSAPWERAEFLPCSRLRVLSWFAGKIMWTNGPASMTLPFWQIGSTCLIFAALPVVFGSLRQTAGTTLFAPSHEDTFSRLQQLGEELKEAWKKLENVPANIMKFLRQHLVPREHPSHFLMTKYWSGSANANWKASFQGAYYLPTKPDDWQSQRIFRSARSPRTN